MTSRDFCYWLQGFLEVANPSELNATQTEAIKRHLSLVFIHEIDPSMGDAKKQTQLNATHDANPKPSPYDAGAGGLKYRC